jgi:hypothetical protein
MSEIETEIINFWGRENLRRWDFDTVDKIDFPPDTREFLTNVGLPKTEVNDTEIYEKFLNLDVLTTLFDENGEDSPNPTTSKMLRAFAVDGLNPNCFCIRESDGMVFFYSPDISDSPVLLNSSIALFGLFITIIQKNISDPKIKNFDFKERMISAFSEAETVEVFNPESLWMIALDELEDRLL